MPAPLSSRVDAGTALAPGTRDVSAAAKSMSSAGEALEHVHESLAGAAQTTSSAVQAHLTTCTEISGIAHFLRGKGQKSL